MHPLALHICPMTGPSRMATAHTVLLLDSGGGSTMMHMLVTCDDSILTYRFFRQFQGTQNKMGRSFGLVLAALLPGLAAGHLEFFCASSVFSNHSQ